MPYMREKSIVYFIEDIIADNSLLADVAGNIISGCKCTIVDSPFTAEVSIDGFVVNRVVGVGSVVCEPGCHASKKSYILAEPTWGQGRVIKRGLSCLYSGDSKLRAQLAGLGFKVTDITLRDLVESVTKSPSHGIAVLSREADPLEVEEESGTCGPLGTPNPLHPAAALGKTGTHACVEQLYQFVGPLSRLTMPILYLEDTKRTLISRIEGLGSALVIHTNLETASKNIETSAWLGMLYECGSSEEYL